MFTNFSRTPTLLKALVLITLFCCGPVMAMDQDNKEESSTVHVKPKGSHAKEEAIRTSAVARAARIDRLEARFKAFGGKADVAAYIHNGRTNLIARLKKENTAANPPEVLRAMKNVRITMIKRNAHVFHALWDHFFTQATPFLSSADNTWSLSKINDLIEASIAAYVPKPAPTPKKCCFACSGCCEKGGCCFSACCCTPKGSCFAASGCDCLKCTISWLTCGIFCNP